SLAALGGGGGPVRGLSWRAGTGGGLSALGAAADSGTGGGTGGGLSTGDLPWGSRAAGAKRVPEGPKSRDMGRVLLEVDGRGYRVAVIWSTWGSSPARSPLRTGSESCCAG